MLEQFPDIGAPDWGLSAEPEADVESISLGDGYEIRRPAGLNHVKESWSPSWSSLDPAVATDAYNWLRARLKWKAFIWVNPLDGLETRVICTSARVSHADYGNSALSATFKQDHNPA